MGMLVMGSGISPLMRHLDLHARRSSLSRQNIGAAELPVNESVAKGGPVSEFGPEPVISTSTSLPDERVRAVEVDDPEVRRAAGDPPLPVDRLDEDLLRRAHAGRVAPPLPTAAGARSGRLEAAPLLVLGDVVRQAERPWCRGAASR